MKNQKLYNQGLKFAAKHGYLDCLKFLVYQGADVNFIINKNNSSIKFVSRKTETQIQSILHKENLSYFIELNKSKEETECDS